MSIEHGVSENQLASASLGKRLLAFMYDLFILAALSMAYSAITTLAMVQLFDIGNPGDYRPMGNQLMFGLGWLLTITAFYWFFWRRAGQTIGMRAWRLKLIDEQAAKLQHWQILTRIVLAPLALFIVGIGYFWCLIDKEKRALHDIASKTRVVVLPKLEKKIH